MQCKPNKRTNYCSIVSHEEVEVGIDETLKGSPNISKKIGWGKILFKLLNPWTHVKLWWRVGKALLRGIWRCIKASGIEDF